MKRSAKLYRAISVTSAMLAFTSVSRADFSYDFDLLSGSASPGTPLVGGSTFAGTVGQDNWILTSGATPQVRDDPVTGLGGNYITSTAAIPTSGFDSIVTRLNPGAGSLGIDASSGFATFQFDGMVGPGYVNASNATVAKRSEIAPGVDSNLDGDIRGTATAGENNEVAFQFGYEPTGTGWFVRRAAFSNTGSITANTTASGVYRMQLVVNFNANPVVIGGQTFNDGAGTLYVKQLADANGNPVNDVYRLADPTTANVNLGLNTGLGTLGAANPANWNGVMARVANNGGLDNIIFGSGLPATPPTWATDAGNWLSSGNWYLTVPNAVDAEADFTMGARTASTVYADSPVTVGTMKFNNPFGYVISGAGSLTLQTSSGSALIDVQQGTQKINLPLVLASDTTMNVAGGATLIIGNPVSIAAGKVLTKNGNVLVQAPLTVATGAKLVLNSGPTTLFNAPSLASGASVDVRNNSLKIDYSGQSSPAVAIQNQLASGYAGGAWNGAGINTSSATSDKGLGWLEDVGNQSITVQYAYYGDSNLDKTVDTIDFNLLAANFSGAGRVWGQGDFNYDGVVDTVDFNLLASNFGKTLPASAFGTLVPEPGACGAIVGAALTIMRRRRRFV